MTLIVEDGSIVVDANTYITVDEYIAWALARGYTIAPEDAETQIVLTMDYLESLMFNGIKKTSSQSLQFPREKLYIDGYLSSSSAIPKELKNSQMTIALEINNGNNPLATLPRAIKSKKVDVLETVYMDNASISPISQSIYSALRKLISGSSSGIYFVVRKA